MTALAEAPRFPEALEDDNDDVAWALQTAAVQWNRGGRADAIVWLRRAVDTAIDLGLIERAQELNRMTEALDSFVQAGGDLALVGRAPSGPPGSGGTPSSSPSSHDVDALLDDSSDLPSVELGAYEVASQSLVDAVELEAAESLDAMPDLVREADIEQADDAEEIEELEELEEVEILDEVDVEVELEDIEPEPEPEPPPLALTRPRSQPPPRSYPPPSPLQPPQSPPPPPGSAYPSRRSVPPRASVSPRTSAPPPYARSSAPPRSAAPVSSAPPRSAAPVSSSTPPRSAPPRSAAPVSSAPPRSSLTPPPKPRSKFPPRPSSEPPAPSRPAVQPYRESLDRTEETTQRRSSPFASPSEPAASSAPSSAPPSTPASRPYIDEDEQPTGVRELPPASLTAVQLSRPSEPELIDEELAEEVEPELVEPEDAEAEPEVAEIEVAEPEVLKPEVRDFVSSEAPTAPPPELAAAEPDLDDEDLYLPDSEPAPAPSEPEVAEAAPAAPSEPAEAPAECGEPSIGGVVLAEVRGLEDLPPETQEELVARARIEKLGPEEEVGSFGLALVLRGEVAVMPTIADVACARASAGEPVFTAGNLKDGVEMRVVALGDGAEVAVWQNEDFEGAMASCPWVADELREVADRFQALAGATMGPLGEQLDDTMRAMVLDRATVKRLEPGEQLTEKDKPLPGLHIVGAGRLEVEGASELLAGDLLFASQLLSGARTPATVVAGDRGALVLFLDRMTTHELMMAIPPLLELLATA